MQVHSVLLGVHSDIGLVHSDIMQEYCDIKGVHAAVGLTYSVLLDFYKMGVKEQSKKKGALQLLLIFYYLRLSFLNFSLLTCLYCGLVPPNTDLIYFLTSKATSTNPVPSAYSILLRLIRALLMPV